MPVRCCALGSIRDDEARVASSVVKDLKAWRHPQRTKNHIGSVIVSILAAGRVVVSVQ